MRRRLSWFSPITDNALFVNQRGQRVGEQSLDSLARMMAIGQAHMVTSEQAAAWSTAPGKARSMPCAALPAAAPAPPRSHAA